MDGIMRGIGGAAWEMWRWSTHKRRVDDGSWIVDGGRREDESEWERCTWAGY